MFVEEEESCCFYARYASFNTTVTCCHEEICHSSPKIHTQNLPGQAEVSHFDFVSIAHKAISSCQITMDVILGLEVRHSITDLKAHGKKLSCILFQLTSMTSKKGQEGACWFVVYGGPCFAVLGVKGKIDNGEYKM